MSKKKVTLEEAKDIPGTDKIFYNGNSKFNVVDAGKYHSGITIEIPQAWTVNKKRKLESPISNKSYGYSREGYDLFISNVAQYQEKITKEQEEIRRKAEELRKTAELKRRKDEAKKMKYPEKFEFWNRLGGATGLGHAYIIESDGTIREPDYNNLSNNNHKYKYSDWKNIADGTQWYMQILPGEIIVSYTKDYTAVPYIFNLEWADDEITEAQLEVICNELAEKQHLI